MKQDLSSVKELGDTTQMDFRRQEFVFISFVFPFRMCHSSIPRPTPVRETESNRLDPEQIVLILGQTNAYLPFIHLLSAFIQFPEMQGEANLCLLNSTDFIFSCPQTAL